MALHNQEEEKRLLQHSAVRNILSVNDIASIQSYPSYKSYGSQNSRDSNQGNPPQQYLKSLESKTASLNSKHSSPASLRTPSSLQSLLNVNYGDFTTKGANRLQIFTKIVVPFYMITFVFTIFGIILYYALPYNDFHDTIFTVFLTTTIFGAIIGCICEYKWSAITAFKQLLEFKNREWKSSIGSLTKTKVDLCRKVKRMEFSVDKLSISAAELEKTLHEFDELKEALEKITTKSKEVIDVLDNLLIICDDLTNLIREHAKTELMVAYYDTAVFAKNSRTNSIRITTNKWKNFRARLDSETRRVFDEKGGFEALDTDRDGKVYIADLTAVLSFVIDERGFDDIYTMFD